MGGGGYFSLKGDLFIPDQLFLPFSLLFLDINLKKKNQRSDVSCPPLRIHPWADSENLSFQSVLSIALKTNLFIKNKIRRGRGKTQQEHVFLLEESFNFTIIV